MDNYSSTKPSYRPRLRAYFAVVAWHRGRGWMTRGPMQDEQDLVWNKIVCMLRETGGGTRGIFEGESMMVLFDTKVLVYASRDQGKT